MQIKLKKNIFEQMTHNVHLSRITFLLFSSSSFSLFRLVGHLNLIFTHPVKYSVIVLLLIFCLFFRGGLIKCG